MIRALFQVKNRYKRSGFTLIELLVVVLILSVLMAIATPAYLSAVSDSQKKTCRSNMQTISNSVHSARVKSMAVDYASVIAGGVNTATLPDLNMIPLCPSGGSYSLANGSSGDAKTFQVSCSISGHGSYEVGVDSH